MLATLTPRKPAWALARRRACLRFGVRPNAVEASLGQAIGDTITGSAAQAEREQQQRDQMYGLASGSGRPGLTVGASTSQAFSQSVDNGIADRAWSRQEAAAYDRGDYVPGGGVVGSELPGMGGASAGGRRLDSLFSDPHVIASGRTSQGLAYEDWSSGARATEVRQANIEATALAPLAVEGNGLLANGRASMNSYWSDKQDAAVASGSALSYLTARGMQALGNFGYSLADMSVAVYNNPEQSVAGGFKSIGNFGPDAFNSATNLLKTSLNGYSMLAEILVAGDGTFAGFRESNAYNIAPLFSYDNQAQAGGALLTQVALGAGLAKYGDYSIELNTGSPGTLSMNPMPLRLVAPETSLIAEPVWTSSLDIRQSQQSISYAKRGGYTLDDISRGYAENPQDPRLIIDAVRMPDAGLTSLDNSRPAVLNAQGGGQIQVRIRGYDESLATQGEIDRFTAIRSNGEVRIPSTWGEAVDYRIWKQGDQFMTQYPNGTGLVPKVTGAPAGSIWSQFNKYQWQR